MSSMAVERPPRPPAGAVSDAVRSAILAEAHRRGLQAPAFLAFHAEADYHADLRHVLADVEQRYAMTAGSFAWRVARRMLSFEPPPNFQQVVDQKVFSDAGAGPVLLELPETEFLTVLKNTLKIAFHNDRIHPQQVVDLYAYAGEALRAHGTPYRATGNDWDFEWIGDPVVHELTIGPALIALADARLRGGPSDDFERALLKRRLGTQKDLEDAIIAAAKSVSRG